jgi:hypothetical protein
MSEQEIVRLRDDIIKLQDSLGRHGFMLLDVQTQVGQVRRDIHDIKTAVEKPHDGA